MLNQFLQISFAFLVSFNLLGQDKLIDPIRLRNLPSYDNYSVFEDKDGFIWIYSENGLLKFNFNHSIYYTTENGLPTNDIFGLMQDRYKRIWLMHHSTGLYYIEKNKIHSIPQAKKYYSLEPLGEHMDTVFFMSNDIYNEQIYRHVFYYTYAGKFGKYHEKNKDKKFLTVYESQIQLIKNNNHSLILSSKTLGNRIINFFPINNPSSKNKRGEHIFFNKNKDSLLLISKNSIKITSCKKFFGFNPIYYEVFSDGHALIEGNNQYFYFTDLFRKRRDKKLCKVVQQYYKKYGRLFHIFQDQTGNIWITLNRGSVYFMPFSFLSTPQIEFSAKSEKNNLNFYSLFNWKTSFFASSRNLELYKWDYKKNKIETLKKNTVVKGITQRKNLIAYYEILPSYLTIFDINTNKTKKIKGPTRPVFSACFLDSIHVFCSNDYVFNIKTKTYRRLNILSQYKRINVLFVHNSYLYTAGKDFIEIFDLKSKKSIYKKANVVTKKIVLIDGFVYYLTENNGLMRFSKNAIYLGNCIANENLYDIVGINQKLYLLALDKIFVIKWLGKQKSLPNIQKRVDLNLLLNGIQAQAISNYDSSLIIGTTSGVLKINVDDLNKSFGKEKTKLYLRNVKVNQRIVDPSKLSALENNENKFEFEFDVIKYCGFGNNELFYKLDNYDDNWHSTKENTLIYGSLPSGNYTLRVYAVSQGEKSEPFVQTISIKKAWWETSIAIFIFIVLFIVLQVSIFVWLKKRIQRINEKKHKLAELEMKALKSQLNPHFIFNSLNSLQSLMFVGKEMRTNQYLVSLSKLMRRVLDNSRENKILLSDEIDFLKNYVHLINEKFDEPVEFSIELKNIDNPDNILIRNMFIQPFLENSFMHGFVGKDHGKIVKIEMERKDQFLEVTIFDNGIGRIASSEYKSKNKNSHRSWASSILQEKRELLNNLYKDGIDYTYTDLYEGSTPTGTLLTIKLKIL